MPSAHASLFNRSTAQAAPPVFPEFCIVSQQPQFSSVGLQVMLQYFADNFMQNFAQSLIHNFDLEEQLKTLVNWSLEQSYSKFYSHAEKLTLLDHAWDMQKILWSVRNI